MGGCVCACARVAQVVQSSAGSALGSQQLSRLFFSFLIIREHTALLYWAGSASLPGPGAQSGALKSLLSVRTFCKFRVRSERVQSLEPGPALVLMIVGVCLYTVKQLPMEDM